MNNYPSYVISNKYYYENVVSKFYETISRAKTEEDYNFALSSVCRCYRREFTDDAVMAYMVNELGFEDEATVNQWYIDNAGPLQKSFLAADLVPGNKYTLVYNNDFGFPVSVQITLDSMKICSYAQYDDAVYLTFKPKGKRKLVGKYFYGYKGHIKVAIYDGWKTLPENFGYEVIRSTPECTTKKSKYASFDDRFITDTEEYFGTPLLQIS